MKIWRAVIVGISGGILVYGIVLAAGIISARHADLCLLLGSTVTGAAGAWTWMIGAGAQLAVATIAALSYAAIFEWITNRADALIGFSIAFAHAAAAGIAIGFLPAQRLLDAGIAPPGAFLEYRGRVVVAGFITAHVLFGTTVGALYGRTRHANAAETSVRRDVGV